MSMPLISRPLCFAAAALMLAGMAACPALAQAPAAATSSATPAPSSVANLNPILQVEYDLGSEAWRDDKLAASPRKHEIAAIKVGARTLKAFVVHPLTPGKTPVVLMAPEDQGIGGWARNMADEIAAMGYTVVMPDYFSGEGPNGGDRDSFPDLRSVFEYHHFHPDSEAQMTGDLNAWADWSKALPAFNGKLAVVGFAWGGGRAFWFATQRHDLAATFIFYDVAPPPSALAGLSAPVYAFYAEHDARVVKTLDATKAAMAQLGKAYEPVFYPGADHMFVRMGEEPKDLNPANVWARNDSLARLQALLAKL
ncbi:MAG TPA: dienelactone hydrolase family protein [Caulobacteraceae bacterium]|nr:dienelactone hydrolase family protein [Caulobacteraceae bacterium]